MNMKALFGTLFALLFAVIGTAYLVFRGVSPAAPPPPPPAELVDEKSENPFDLTKPSPHSKVVVAESHFDFGIMALGGTQSHEFVFKNEGKGSLQLAEGPVMCKCTIPTVGDAEIKTGESVRIKLEWKPVEMSSDFSKEAVIWTNDPAKPKVTLSIKGQVFADPMMYPSQFAVGSIPWDKESESEVKLASSTGADLQIEGVEVSHPKWMSVTWTPADVASLLEAGVTTPKPQSGFNVLLKISPDGSVGPFNGWVNLKVNRVEKEQKIDVVGIRSGPIQIHGNDFQSSQSLLNIKRFKSADGKEMKIFLRLKSFGPDLQLLDVTSKSKNLTATLRKESAAEDKKDLYVLLIQAKKGAAAGTSYSLDDPDLLTLQLNHPLVPELIIKTAYIVQ